MNLLRFEWTKMMKMRSTYIVFVVAAVLIVLVHWGVYFGAPKSDIYRRLTRMNLDTSLLVNGYVSTRLIMEVGFAILIAPMTILIFARQIAGESQRGTLRLMLTRPIGRLGLLNAKFLVCAFFCIVLMGFFISLAYGIGLALYGPNDTITVGHLDELDPRTYAPPEEVQRADENWRRHDRETPQQGDARRAQWRGMRDVRNQVLVEFVITPRESIRRMAYVWLLSSWSLLGLGALAFFYSSFNRHPIAAMALTIGTYFMLFVLQGLASADNIIPLFKNLEPYLLTTVMDFWREALSHEIDWSKIRHEGLLLGTYTLIFFSAAQVIFYRKDITS